MRTQRIRRLFAVAGLLGAAMAAVSGQSSTASTTWNTGDVFVGVASGRYQVYDNAGNFKETISDGLGGFTTGCAFNPAEDRLYTTDFSTNDVVVYDAASPHAIAQTIDTTGSGALSNESVVFAGDGSFYVGHADGNKALQHYDPSGTLIQEFFPAVEARGTDWIDLAADQKTMFYTSEHFGVKRFDVSTGTQLPDFATLPNRPAFALRLLPPGDGTGGVLVADSANIVRLDGAGSVVQTYDVAGEDSWFALNLDPNGTSFWSGDYSSGNFYRFNLASGAVEVGPVNIGAGALFGICLKGELTAAIGAITLDPPSATNPAGTDHTVTATVTRNGQPEPGVLVSFSVVSGPNTGAASPPGCDPDPGCLTGVNGKVRWTYTSNGTPGTDTIRACFNDVSGQQCATATKTWEQQSTPTTLVLSPKTATNPVDSQHCVTATVSDANGDPMSGVTVRFSVTGSVTTSGSAVTDANGTAQFCYNGPALPGSDAIHAYADTDGDSTQDAGEPGDDATKTWVAPGTSAGCKVTNGGRITAANGDKATFGGVAQGATPPKGNEEYRDHGPATPMNVKSSSVDAVSCPSATTASIFGTATVDGAGSYQYRIDVTDQGEPGVLDTYRIRLSNGYDSGTQLLNQGNIQIQR